MSDRVKAFETANKAKRDTDRWLNMIGREYHGGGGGVGKLHSVAIQSVEVYFQEYNGATNYHGVPSTFIPFIESAFKLYSDKIFETARLLQAEHVQNLAKQAAEEHQMLMEAAGLTEPAEAK
mgnify:CR=1 FL=1